MSSLPAAGQSSDLRPLAEWYLRKGHRRLWFIPLTLGLVALIAVMILRGSMEDPEENYEQSRAAVEALKQPPVPPEENAWTDYQKALAVRVMYKGSNDTNPFYKTDDDSKYFKPEDIQELWKDNADAIALLHACAQKKRCDVGLDLLNTNLNFPSLLNLREMGNLLAMDARCHAIAGNHQAGAKSLRSICSLAKHLESSPLLIMEMMASALRSIADDAFGAIVTFEDLKSIDDLQAYKEALEQQRSDPYQRFARCLEYEIAVTVYQLDAGVSGKVFGRGTMPSNLTPLWHGSDRQCFKAVGEASIHALRSRREPEDTKSAIARHQNGPAIITSMWMPSFSRAYLSSFLTDESARLAVVAAAYLQYRIKHKRDPLTIEQLVPEFLPAIPMGIFHDKPIRFTAEKPHKPVSTILSGSWLYQDKPSIRIYTVGRNGVDDGGNSEGGYTNLNEADDTVFFLPPLRKADQ
jgi:hypothetical protein